MPVQLQILFPNGEVLAVLPYVDDPVLGPIPWDGSITGTVTATVTNDGTFATPGKQDTGNTSLASIDGKLTNPLPISGAVSVSGTVSVDTITNPVTVETEAIVSEVDQNYTSGTEQPLNMSLGGRLKVTTLSDEDKSAFDLVSAFDVPPTSGNFGLSNEFTIDNAWES